MLKNESIWLGFLMAGCWLAIESYWRLRIVGIGLVVGKIGCWW
jgi:hypothetical protein